VLKIAFTKTNPMDVELLFVIIALNVVAWIVCDFIEQARTKHSD